MNEESKDRGSRSARQWTAGILGLLAVLNGLAMLVAPHTWFESVPGVVQSGPMNRHFVYDVGLAFIASGCALGAFGWRRRWLLLAFGGSWFLAGHGALHLLMVVRGTSAVPVADSFAVALPAALAVWVTWPRASDRSPSPRPRSPA